MLYVYDFCDDFYADVTGNETGNDEETLLKAISECKDLKPYDNDCLWISKSETVLLNGKEMKATDKFYAYVDKGWFWDESDFVKITTDFTDGGLEITKAKASELLSDDLRQETHTELGYEDRIWNAEDPTEEVYKIINELTICVFETVIEDLKSQLDKMESDNIEWN